MVTDPDYRDFAILLFGFAGSAESMTVERLGNGEGTANHRITQRKGRGSTLRQGDRSASGFLGSIDLQ